jgi:hypothetical protein
VLTAPTTPTSTGFWRRRVAPSTPPFSGAASTRSLAGRALALKEKIFPASDGHDDEHGGHQAAMNDALVLLGTTVVIIPLMRRFNVNPILGFLAAGIALGPNGFGLVNNLGASKAIAELGV